MKQTKTYWSFIKAFICKTFYHIARSKSNKIQNKFVLRFFKLCDIILHMKKYELFSITNTEKLKHPTIFFFLKQNGFSEHYISGLRNTPDAILLNGKPVNIREKIQNADTLQIVQNPSKKTNIAHCDGTLYILFEDEDFLVVNKPHNLACTPTRSHFHNNLGGQICKYMSADENFVLRILNRLDREAAGIVVVAKHPLAYANMQDFKKTYHALVHGKVEGNITIQDPILTVTKDGINQIKRVISPQGKPSVTHLQLLQNFSSTSLVKLTLETGRTHQIRVHASSIGHPLVGDTIYGKEEDVKNNPNSHAMLLLKEICFTHFRTKKPVQLCVPYPSDWQPFFEQKEAAPAKI